MNAEQWLDVVAMAASALEFTGAILMANALLNVRQGKIRMLFKSLYRSQSVRDLTELSDGLTKEQKVKSLQGLAFISLGFLVGAVVATVELTGGA